MGVYNKYAISNLVVVVRILVVNKKWMQHTVLIVAKM